MVAYHSGRRVSLGLSLVVVALLMMSLIPPGRAALASNVPQVQGSGAIPLDEIETLAYHEITRWETDVNTRGEESPILSDDGKVIAFSRSPGSGDPANPNKLYVVNTDGSGEHEIDSYTPLCYCGSLLDLSGDGQRIVTTDSLQIRAADASGNAGRELLALDVNEINAIRISGDGETIIFRVYRDTTYLDSPEPFERGIYAINYDGSNLRQLIGPDDLAPVLGVPLDEVPFFAGGMIDLSHDGNQIIFGMFIEPEAGGAGQGLFATDLSGSTPRMLLDRVGFITTATISNDGSTVAYVTVDIDTGDQTAGSIGFDGSGDHVLTTNTDLGMGLPGTDVRLRLNSDGSRLLLGETGLLFDTQTAEHLALSATDVTHGPDQPPALVLEGLVRPTMDRDAKRLLFMQADARNVYQLAILDIEPADLSDAPVITDASVAPASIPLNGGSTATVQAHVTSNYPYLIVGTNVFVDGLPDDNVSSAYYGPLVDDGLTLGDNTAGDDIYTTDKLAANCCAVPGPRVVRIKAETQDTNGFRHASTLNITPFSVEGDAPTATVVATATTPPDTGNSTGSTATATPVDSGSTGSTGSSGDWSEWVGVADPADCTIAPVTADYVVTAMNNAVSNPPDLLIADPETIDDLPIGEPVDAATTDAVLQTTWEVNACANAGEFGRLLALFTPDGLERVIASAFAALADPSAPDSTPTAEELAELASNVESVLAAPPTPLEESERAGLDEILRVEMLPDGRIVVVFAGDSLVASGQAVTIFELVGDRWLIAEMHSIGEDIDLNSAMG